MSVFEAETALTQVSEDSYRGFVSKHWNIGDNPNGGYLVTQVLGAIAQITPEHPDPLSVTTHYLRPGTADAPCEVHLERVRQGRTITTARARLVQQGKTRLEVLAAFGNLSRSQAAGTSEDAITLAAPDLPPPLECPERSGEAQGVVLPIRERIEIRVQPGQPEPGAMNGKAEVSGWIRLRDGAPTSSIAAVMFTDAFPPALFGRLGVIGWVPTIELTVHVRRRPQSAWLQGRFVTDDLHGGRMIESGALWDETGALVAQSRQLGMLLANRA